MGEKRYSRPAAAQAPALRLPVVHDPEFAEWRNEDGSLSEEQFQRTDIDTDNTAITHWQVFAREER